MRHCSDVTQECNQSSGQTLLFIIIICTIGSNETINSKKTTRASALPSSSLSRDSWKQLHPSK